MFRDRIALLYHDNELILVIWHYIKLNTVILTVFLRYNIHIINFIIYLPLELDTLIDEND
jgi:hypothetical protein